MLKISPNVTPTGEVIREYLVCCSVQHGRFMHPADGVFIRINEIKMKWYLVRLGDTYLNNLAYTKQKSYFAVGFINH